MIDQDGPGRHMAPKPFVLVTGRFWHVVEDRWLCVPEMLDAAVTRAQVYTGACAVDPTPRLRSRASI